MANRQVHSPFSLAKTAPGYAGAGRHRCSLPAIGKDSECLWPDSSQGPDRWPGIAGSNHPVN